MGGREAASMLAQASTCWRTRQDSETLISTELDSRVKLPPTFSFTSSTISSKSFCDVNSEPD